jgi:hypothetical protein
MRNGYRVGSYLVLIDTEGLRHAVRVTSILSVSDADLCQDTAVVVAAGRQIIVPASWETVMGWIDGSVEAEEPSEPDPAPDALPDSVLDIEEALVG